MYVLIVGLCQAGLFHASSWRTFLAGRDPSPFPQACEGVFCLRGLGLGGDADEVGEDFVGGFYAVGDGEVADDGEFVVGA